MVSRVCEMLSWGGVTDCRLYWPPVRAGQDTTSRDMLQGLRRLEQEKIQDLDWRRQRLTPFILAYLAAGSRMTSRLERPHISAGFATIACLAAGSKADIIIYLQVMRGAKILIVFSQTTVF